MQYLTPDTPNIISSQTWERSGVCWCRMRRGRRRGGTLCEMDFGFGGRTCVLNTRIRHAIVRAMTCRICVHMHVTPCVWSASKREGEIEKRREGGGGGRGERRERERVQQDCSQRSRVSRVDRGGERCGFRKTAGCLSKTPWLDSDLQKVLTRM